MERGCPGPRSFRGTRADVLCGRAAGWISESGKRKPESGVGGNDGRDSFRSPVSGLRFRPWFCVVSLEPPHPPYGAPVPGGGAEWRPSDIALPPNVPRGGDVEEAARRELAGYYAHVEATDRAIGRLIAAAPRENTVVVFTSVHGDMHGAHGLFRKGWPYEESVRVPLLVRVPGGRRGVQDPALVSLADLPDLTLRWAGGEDRAIRAEFQRISMPCVVRLPRQCDRVWRGGRTSARKLVMAEDGVPWLVFRPGAGSRRGDQPSGRSRAGGGDRGVPATTMEGAGELVTGPGSMLPRGRPGQPGRRPSR